MIFRVVAKIIYTVLVIIETLIVIRFVFKLVGSNAANVIVNWVYNASNVFVDPFKGIIPVNWTIGRFIIDLDAVLALIVYMVLAFIIVEILKVFSADSKKSQ
ncbi:YggT family protein [Candidatus Dojkabacteria bacterium]|nr:YggT family protein [Candidatus Dojkabacteria bacterium]